MELSDETLQQIREMAAALLPPAPPANNSKTQREQALSPENACFFVYFIEKNKKPL